jgi:exopolyphosphatase/guanosine-5'-triphosphate,3'-diphosphate pyrophosphatase
MTKAASIDIGTNTILLLLAEVEDGKIRPLFEKEAVARLGQGLHKSGMLSEEAMERGAGILADYLERCREFGAEKTFAVGTSALREAKNSDDFLAMAKERLGLTIDVISGGEEARLSFLAVSMDLRERKKLVLVVDIGGGSTEFILGRGDRIIQWMSLPLGSVRFAEQFLLSDPVREEEWMGLETEIRKLLLAIPQPEEALRLTAVGGTATTLASVEQGLDRFIPEKIHHFVLKRGSLKKQLDLYRSKTIDERKEIPGLPPNRADVIPAGGAILYLIMETLRCPSVMISSHGVRYGVLYDRLDL